MRKALRKMMALVIAMVMVLAMALPAMAATGELTPDTQVTVGGLEAKDSVKFVKLIKWVPGEGWAWADGFDAAVTAAQAGMSDADKAKVADADAKAALLKTITGWTTPAPATAGQISAADGGLLAQIAQKMTAADTETVPDGAAAGEGSVTYSKPAYPDGATDAQKEQIDVDYMGLYAALVTPATADYLYNPIFVAADYNPDNTNTNSITVEEGALSYQPAALAKKEKVTLTKKSGTPEQGQTAADPMFDVAIGDTIPFTITSVVPAFSSSYVNPVYEISDTMDAGLELLTSPAIVVQVKDKSASSWTTLTLNTEYTITPANPATKGFTVVLKSDYLKANASEKDIQVTYSAKVTSIEDYNVNQKENTATVKFSNNPGDSSKYSLLEDKTNHYTFSLDANLLGNSDWENSELVKIGLKPDGTEITQETLDNRTEAGVLEGAKFGLYTNEGCTTLYTNSNVTPAVTGEFTSDAHGKLNISGLDAGTYYLKEISAPAGYIKSTDVWEIKITPTYATVEAGSYTNDAGILVNYDAYDYLESYKVEVKNLTTNTTVTSDFAITNEGTHEKTATTSSDTDQTTKLNNTQGTELPSTGGIGTTLFYLIGTILVLGAGILLITRRRMSAK